VNWNFVADFPELPKPLINRDHLLRSIEEVVTADAPVLFLEGAPGDGTTCMLAQFCQRHPKQTFSLFIKPASKLTYSLDYLRLVLAEQFHWCLYGEALKKARMTESEFKALSLQIVRKARKSKGNVLYFIIDGLHQIPQEDRTVISQVFSDLLPMGVPGCRFIISGLQQDLSIYLHRSVTSRYYQLPKFSIEECKTFLACTGIDPVECERVYELCKGGSPGQVAVVQRLLIAGTPLSELLEKDPGQYLEFVKLEFECLKSLTDKERLLVANIAYSKVTYTIEKLSDLGQVDTTTTSNLVKKCAFLRISPSGQLEFISEAHRQHAGKQLESLKKPALEEQLRYLQRNPKSENALRFLPTYLETLSQGEAIFELLSKEHYTSLLETTQSFAALKEQAATAVQSAISMKRMHEAFKFSLHRSIFASASSAEGTTDRIRALVALGKTNTALALANAEPTKEDRLALLSTFARRLVERNGKIESELIEHIHRLIKEVDFSSLGDKAINIAANVLMFDADSAIGIIESAVKGAAAATKNAAFAELSLSASIAKLRYQSKIEDKAQAKISDESLQQIMHSFGLLSEQLNAGDLTEILAKMPAGHQIHFLRYFVNIKRHSPKILDFVELGLDIIIKETQYTPRARDLAELCAPFLTSIGDLPRLKKLVARIQSQLGLVAKATPSRDITTLQMRLAAGEYQYDRTAARDRILETYYTTMEIKAPEVQMECLAVMLGILTKIDTDGELEKKDGFRAVIKTELSQVLNHVLKETADHIGTVLPVLKVLAVDDCTEALALAARLNVEHRRDIAYQTVSSVIVTQPFNESRLESVKNALTAIRNDNSRSTAVIGILGGLDANPQQFEWISRLDELRHHLTRGVQLSKWDCWMMKAFKAANIEYNTDLFVKRTKEALSRAASVLEEAQLNFRSAEALVDSDVALAETYYREGLRASSTTPFASKPRLKAFELCLSLVSRSMASLAQVNMLDDDMTSRHESLVNKLPSILSQIRAFSEFAERLWCAKRKDLTCKIVTGQLRPLVEQARGLHPSVGHAAITLSFPSLCAAHQGLALDLLADIPDAEADRALHSAAMLKMRHLAGQEPDANRSFDHKRIEIEDVHDIIGLIKYMRTDSAIYSTMKSLVDAVNDKVNRTRFTATQKADWSANLKVIVDEKLPDLKNIQHKGYVIVCTALVYSLIETRWKQWDDLIADARKIDNRADRGYIFLMLAVALPAKFSRGHRETLLQMALEEINKIPSPADRFSRLLSYAQDAYANDLVVSARQSLKEAMILSIQMEHLAQESAHRRDLIDLADQINPSFADQLIEMVDDDPARARLKAEAKQQAAVAKAKRELADAKHLKDTGACDIDLLPEAAWKNLGALEAGRLEIKPPEITMQYVTRVAAGTLYEAYPVLAWHLTNMERKYVSPRDVKSQLAPLCEALLLSTELTEVILSGVAVKDTDINEEPTQESLLLRRRNRLNAITYIEQWLQENARNEIIYCDPYFSTKDIQFLRLCLAHAPECRVQIIASKPQLLKKAELTEEPFLKAWREQSDQSPPETEVVALAYVDEPAKNVVHDRWILSAGAALRLGTSFNSLGDGKLSEISEVDSSQARELAEQLQKYLARKRVVDAARIQYSVFTL
jgi:hypothetical protein